VTTRGGQYIDALIKRKEGRKVKMRFYKCDGCQVGPGLEITPELFTEHRIMGGTMT